MAVSSGGAAGKGPAPGGKVPGGGRVAGSPRTVTRGRGVKAPPVKPLDPTTAAVNAAISAQLSPIQAQIKNANSQFAGDQALSHATAHNVDTNLAGLQQGLTLTGQNQLAGAAQSQANHAGNLQQNTDFLTNILGVQDQYGRGLQAQNASLAGAQGFQKDAQAAANASLGTQSGLNNIGTLRAASQLGAQDFVNHQQQGHDAALADLQAKIAAVQASRPDLLRTYGQQDAALKLSQQNERDQVAQNAASNALTQAGIDSTANNEALNRAAQTAQDTAALTAKQRAAAQAKYDAAAPSLSASLSAIRAGGSNPDKNGKFTIKLDKSIASDPVKLFDYFSRQGVDRSIAWKFIQGQYPGTIANKVKQGFHFDQVSSQWVPITAAAKALVKKQAADANSAATKQKNAAAAASKLKAAQQAIKDKQIKDNPIIPENPIAMIGTGVL